MVPKVIQPYILQQHGMQASHPRERSPFTLSMKEEFKEEHIIIFIFCYECTCKLFFFFFHSCLFITKEKRQAIHPSLDQSHCKNQGLKGKGEDLSKEEYCKKHPNA